MSQKRNLTTMALIIGGWASPAAAENLKVDFTATVTYVIGDAGGAVSVGEPADGSFTVDCDAEKEVFTPESQGIYLDAINKFQTKFGGHKVKYSANGPQAAAIEPRLVIYNEQDFYQGADAFGLHMEPDGQPIQGVDPTSMDFLLKDSTGLIYDTTDLPASLDLNDFDQASVRVYFGGGWQQPGGWTVVMYLDTLTVKSECDACIDADGDGFCAEDDCDDADPLVYPGAADPYLDCDAIVDCLGDPGGAAGDWTVMTVSGSPPSIPDGLKVTCLEDPSTLVLTDCPVAVCDGVTYWPLSHYDNRNETEMVGYDELGQIVRRISRPAARYAYDISVDPETQAVIVHGQSDNTSVFGWSELAP